MEAGGRRRHLMAATVAVAAATLGVGVWIALKIGGEQAALWADDTLTPVAAAVACLACLRARRRRTGRLRTFWMIMAVATALWTGAEVTWGVYVLILGQEVPSPSWADLGYLSAVFAVAVALVMHPAMHSGTTRALRTVLDGVGTAAALLFLSWTFVLGPLWRSTDLSTTGGVVTVAYPFGDVVILFLVVLVIRRMRGAEQTSLWWLLAGLSMLAFSDTVYTYMAESVTYQTGIAHLLDVGWIAAYFGIALAALADDGDQVGEPAIVLARPSTASLVAPLVLVLVALVAAAVRIEAGHHIDRAGWVMAVSLIVVVFVRQGLMVMELLRAGDAGRPASGQSTTGPSAVGALSAVRPHTPGGGHAA
jgi:hypothetical protein